MSWGIAGALATLAVMPYMLALFPELRQKLATRHVPEFAAAMLQAVQAAVILSAASWVGLRLGHTIGLDSPLARAVVYRTARPRLSLAALSAAAVSGAVIGFTILAIDWLWFASRVPAHAAIHIARWKCLLASFYGGIVEELICRLLLMSLLAWVIAKLTRSRSSAVFVVAITLASLLFAAGHLPAAKRLWPLTPIVISRVMLLNSLPGILFGAWYWRRGLEHAMISHFVADLAVHVVAGG
jgi:membrane protease YdiL (CAAX protease family)